MNILLWVLQIALALFFLVPATMKIRTPKCQLIEKGQLAPGDSTVPVRTIGLLELLGSLGIILPMWLGILPILTPLAATCFCLVMVGAMALHAKKSEYKVLSLLVMVFIAAAFVAWNRFEQLAS
ncbi:DoxX family protein [Larkinella sp. GY13]|uniref:DoxX family protein n=1 Tax=Larkinella sp. GY13 TaxID=3453720 RepID=UPI003EEBC3E5